MVDSLALYGIANEIAGNSAPSSGSEHLISHALDKLLVEPQLHGIQAGIATYLMSKVQDHRWVRVNQVLTDTRILELCRNVKFEKEDYLVRY